MFLFKHTCKNNALPPQSSSKYVLWAAKWNCSCLQYTEAASGSKVSVRSQSCIPAWSNKMESRTVLLYYRKWQLTKSHIFALWLLSVIKNSRKCSWNTSIKVVSDLYNSGLIITFAAVVVQWSERCLPVGMFRVRIRNRAIVKALKMALVVPMLYAQIRRN